MVHSCKRLQSPTKKYYQQTFKLLTSLLFYHSTEPMASYAATVHTFKASA